MVLIITLTGSLFSACRPFPDASPLAAALLLTLGAAPAATRPTATASSRCRSPAPPASRSRPASSPRKSTAAPRVEGPRLRASTPRSPGTTASPRPASSRSWLTPGQPAWISETGRDVLPRRAPPAPRRPAGPAPGRATHPAYPTSQTFSLHSRPGASKQIYLDFNGADLWNSAWSTSRATPSRPAPTPATTATATRTRTAPPSTPGCRRSGARSRRHYAPFDVDVTTADPGADALPTDHRATRRSGPGRVHQPRRRRPQAAPRSASGSPSWAPSGPDRQRHYQPAFVFTGTTMSPIMPPRAPPHEAGHTLGPEPRRHHLRGLLRRQPAVGSGHGLGVRPG